MVATKQLSQITGALYRAWNDCGNLLSENVQVKRQPFVDHIDPKEHISIDSAAIRERSTDNLSVKRKHCGVKSSVTERVDTLRRPLNAGRASGLTA
jgi:hypothetical protein